MDQPIEIAAAARSIIHERSLAAYPREACGLLIGTSSRALLAVACRNLSVEPDRFELHPEDFLAAELSAEAQGVAVLGAWHSHPDQPAVPSEIDLENAYHAWVHVICSVDARGVRALRGWSIAERTFTERPITAVD